MINNARNQLQAFGVRLEDCVDLRRKDDPRLLRYVDLARHDSTPLVDTVVETQAQQALLYVIDATRLNGSINPQSIDELRRKLAMRGDQAWLGILRIGRLEIYATDLQPADNTPPVCFSAEHEGSLGVVARLAQGENLAKPSALLLRSVLFGLMTDAGQELKSLGLSTDETIALTGRALFFRYLIGRKIICGEHLPAISPSSQSLMHCFSNVQNLLETNTWLDKTFNGDLLALPVNRDAYPEYFKKLGDRISRPLEAILGLDQPITPGVSQRNLNWNDLDFDHLPVGLLSETYEELMYLFDADARRDTSVYYTPSHIAEYMVGEAFHQHPAGASARILDPACGAGVFLVACFRKLAELKFAETGQRPDRNVLRQILDEQLIGFDINAHARTLAALALYLTALELDPDPAPVEALTFKKLEGHVLIDVADPDSARNIIQPMAGSLGPHVPKCYKGQFDLVIGNPPWTSLKSTYKNIDQLFTARCRAVAAQRGLDDIARSYKNPDQVPDLPFVWGAMDWAKPNGRIALALAGRWLFKMSDAGFAARSAIFRAVAVTGILNGASIRQSQVWPNVAQPFCLVFADNRLPTESDQFVLVSPENEPDLNDKGRMRIDASDATPIALDLAAKQPALIKTLYRGSALDFAIVQRMRAKSQTTIGEYWVPSKGLYCGQGFTVAKRTKDDSFLVGYPELDARYHTHPFVVNAESLSAYVSQGLYRPCRLELYSAPLLLIREGCKPDRSLGRALYSSANLAYSKSYYGFSATKNPDGEFHTQYLLVLVHSQLFEYWSLMTSAKFGVEREVLQMLDVESFPFVPLAALSPTMRSNVEACASALLDNQPDWEKLDTTIASIYGLGRYDQEVITDTLTTRAPFSKAKKLAATPCLKSQSENFCARVQKELSSVLSMNGYVVHVAQFPDKSRSPWKFIAVSLGEQALPETLPSTWVEYADDLAVSRITIVDDARPLIIVGLLDRYRYWTQTQARLLSSDILWQYGALLEERAGR